MVNNQDKYYEEKYNTLKKILLFLSGCGILVFFGNINIKSIFRSDILSTFRENLFYLNNLLGKFKGMIIVLVILGIYWIIKNRWVFRIEKMSYGGITFICNKPNNILKQSIKNFLNTKRTLFVIDSEKDNFFDTINSYYATYNFIRNEMLTYDINCKDNTLYSVANDMIQALNEFLTNNQSDYKRWYEYIIQHKIENVYNKDIHEIQKEYRNYDKILKDFKKVNETFCRYSNMFEIDIDKWIRKEGKKY